MYIFCLVKPDYLTSGNVLQTIKVYCGPFRFPSRLSFLLVWGHFQDLFTAFWEPSTQQSAEKPRAKASPKGHSATDTVGFSYPAENIWGSSCPKTRREGRRDEAGTRSLREDLQSWVGCCCPLPWPSLFDLTLSSSLLASLGL